MNKLKFKVINWLLVKRFGLTENNEIKQLLEELDSVSKLNEELKKKVGNPIEVVRRLTDEQFRFYDYTELDKQGLQQYHGSAQNALKSEALQNEVKHLNSELAIYAAKQSPNHQITEAMRYQISGINLLIERLESIPNPNNKPDVVQEPYAGL